MLWFEIKNRVVLYTINSITMSIDTLLEQGRIDIGQRIERVLKEKDLSIEQFSRDCKMSKRTVYNILQGKNYTISSFLTVCHILGIDYSELLDGMNISNLT